MWNKRAIVRNAMKVTTAPAAIPSYGMDDSDPLSPCILLTPSSTPRNHGILSRSSSSAFPGLGRGGPSPTYLTYPICTALLEYCHAAHG